MLLFEGKGIFSDHHVCNLMGWVLFWILYGGVPFLFIVRSNAKAKTTLGMYMVDTRLRENMAITLPLAIFAPKNMLSPISKLRNQPTPPTKVCSLSRPRKYVYYFWQL